MSLQSRDRWSSRNMFLFAAIGSAVGLGNVWRFPYLAYKFGGGSFLIPYAIALFVIGIPLLILELILGQKFQAGGTEAFRNINRRFAGIGIAGVMISFIVVSYYAVVMSWMMIYLFDSITLPWSADSKDYFFNTVLQISPSIHEIGGVNIFVMIALAVVWMSIFFCVFKGVKSAEKVVSITTPLPIILLILLFFRGITLDGAFTGIYYYIKPNFTHLMNSEIWLAAASQIFFTLSIAIGVMIAYASYNRRNEDVQKDAFVISFVNCSISIFAGFVVFSILGYMAESTGQHISEVAASGPGLAFVVFPKALSMMPFPVVFSILFFIMLWTLGVDSAFSLVEAVNTAVRDRFPSLGHTQISLILCTLGFLSGVIYATRAGLYFLDLIDHFIVEFGLIYLGLFQCLAVGWYYGAERLRSEVNEMGNSYLGSWWSYSIKYVIPGILSVLLIEQFMIESSSNYSNYPDWAIHLGAFVAALPFVAVLVGFLKPKKEASLEDLNRLKKIKE